MYTDDEFRRKNPNMKDHIVSFMVELKSGFVKKNCMLFCQVFISFFSFYTISILGF